MLQADSTKREVRAFAFLKISDLALSAISRDAPGDVRRRPTHIKIVALANEICCAALPSVTRPAEEPRLVVAMRVMTRPTGNCPERSLFPLPHCHPKGEGPISRNVVPEKRARE
jgi:hypothetical protein